ncbi:MAG: DUF4097 family beta strand repeat-containing protein [Candidatus Dojkabacteria bacterium]
MKTFQTIIKYTALVFAITLIVVIFKLTIDSLLFVGNLFDKNPRVESLVEREITFDFNDYKNLDIQTMASRLTLKTGDRFSVTTNNKDITVQESKDTIIINDNNRESIYFYNENLELIVVLPTNTTLDSIRIDTGAGKMLIEELNCKNATINLGAGGLEVNKIDVTNEIKISGGIGKITIHHGSLNNLEADLGVGKLSAILSLTGKNNINTGIGGLDLELLDSSTNYTFNIEKGIGDIELNEDSIQTGAYGNGLHTVDISGGIGEIEITTLD